ncbi:unnamed protein product, partial [Amoebophrya sp. A120]
GTTRRAAPSIQQQGVNVKVKISFHEFLQFSTADLRQAHTQAGRSAMYNGQNPIPGKPVVNFFPYLRILFSLFLQAGGSAGYALTAAEVAEFLDKLSDGSRPVAGAGEVLNSSHTKVYSFFDFH